MTASRPIKTSDIHAAQRGLRMVSMSPDRLCEEIALHEGKPAFASRVIVLAAKQILAVKLRNCAA